jgi:hypothetical protein
VNWTWPWRWQGWNFDDFFGRDGHEGWLIGPDGEPVAWATTTEGEDPRIAVKEAATAHLIAAAPLMRDALRAAQELIPLVEDGMGDMHPERREREELIRAALAAAEGK